MASSPGTLFVVATPIGNLEDITLRALRILKEVELIAAEDTRRTSRLLAHYEIRKPLVSLREHNEARESARLIDRIRRGAQIALVSDAGTPAIADPGARLVRAARVAGVQVVPIPGPSAITAALSVSGLESTEFVFMGFPPATGATRRAWFERAAAEVRPVVFFEAPHRIARALEDASEHFGNRPIHTHREISKINEEYIFRPNIGDSTEITQKGEFTVVVGASLAEADTRSTERQTVIEALGHIIDSCGVDDVSIVKVISSALGISESAASRMIKKRKIYIKRQNRSST